MCCLFSLQKPTRWPFLSVLCGTALFFAPLPVHALVDLDNNGWSDLWELAYGKGYDPAGDEDGDGRTNWEEHQAGTDPRDAASVAGEVEVVEKPRGTYTVSFATVAGKQYQLQVSRDGEVWSSLGVPEAGTGAAITKKLPGATTRFPGILQSQYKPFTGNINNLKTGIANSTLLPAETTVLEVGEIPQTKPGQDNYGRWVQGWIKAPATGAYTFYLASDDQGELQLSPSSDPTKAVKIASVEGYTNFEQFDKYPAQTSAPQKLTAGQLYYFQAFVKEWNGGDHFAIAWSGPKLNPNKEILSASYVYTDPQTLAHKLAGVTGASWRVVITDKDTDGDTLTDYEEALSGLDPLNPKSVSRVADLATVTAGLTAGNAITVGAAGGGRGYEAHGTPCRFTFFRAGGLQPLRIRYSIAGTATMGEDYTPTTGEVDLPIGQSSVSIEVIPKKDGVVEAAETLVATVLPDAAYEVGTPASATVTLDDAVDQLYLSTLKAAAGAKSAGYGTAALRVVGNELFGTFSLSYGNLVADTTGAELYVLGAGNKPVVVLTLEPGQIAARSWDFANVAGLSREAIVAALRAGKMYARVKSIRFPVAELVAPFRRYAGSTTPPKPGAYGPTLTRARNNGEAARFLTQATFGPTVLEIEKVKKLGFAAWLNAQVAAPATHHLPYVQARRAELMARDGNDGWQTPRQEAWWQAALTAPDQLRQRMAFALSEIFVVSDVGVLDSSHEGITAWYDMLVDNAFGNFRTLLEKVTLSPIMGQYLSMVRNQKPNPDTGAEPDENYAREVMQLFTIGLNMLNQDGSLQLGPNGLPIPTYTQDDIVGLAHVFTGWGFGYDPAAPPDNLDSYFRYGARDEMRPMIQYAKYHDLKAKKIVRGTVIPAGQTGEQDLKLALDALYKHPNVGPFLARQLIQRFVTSNPSRGYVYRVAAVFNNTGGVRGNLLATLKAVLLDAEARNPALPIAQGYGKLREPLLRMTQLLRAGRAVAPRGAADPRYFINMQYSLPFQAALASPSVFNFFQPGYVQPGKIAAAGLAAPEFQITSETSIVTLSNQLNSVIANGIYLSERDGTTNLRVLLNYDDEVAILSDTNGTLEENRSRLLDHLNALYASGQMTTETRTAILNAWAALPTNYGTGYNQQRDRVRIAIYILTAAPEFAVQK